MVKLHTIFNKRIPKKNGCYDPSAEVAPLDMFKTRTSKLSKSASLPKLVRRASLGGIGNHRGLHGSLRLPTTEFLDLPSEVSSPKKNRRRYNSGPESLKFEGNFSNRLNSFINKNADQELMSAKSLPTENAIHFIKRGARYVKFAVAAYGPNMLKILGYLQLN